MPQIQPAWKEIERFGEMSAQLIAKYPERFDGINPDWIIAYGITNKDKPDGKAKPYDMSGAVEPESFTNSKKYFVKFYMTDWDGRGEETQLALVFSALSRIDRENPPSGKVGPLDYRDQNVMVRTFGADWQERSTIPNLLTADIEFVEDLRADL